MKNKLYVFVDPSLSKSKGAAQAVHAVAELGIKDPETLKQWNNETIVILRNSWENVKSIFKRYVNESTREDGFHDHIIYEAFYDVDLKLDHPTAVAVYPRNDVQRKFCEEEFKYLPLL